MRPSWDDLASKHGKAYRVIAPDPPPAPASNASSSELALLRIARKAQQEHATQGGEVWAASPWRWLRDLKPVPKSRASLNILRRWLGAIGIEAREVKGSVPTLGVPGWPRCVVKMSMMWDDGDYHFQQIRDFDYDGALLFGISPHAAHLWVVERSLALAVSVPQHSTDSRTIAFNPDSPPPRLAGCGGTLEMAVVLLRCLPGRAAA